MPSTAIHRGADLILSLLESERVSLISTYEQQLSSLRYTNEQLLTQYTHLKSLSSSSSNPEIVHIAELQAKLQEVEKQFAEYRVHKEKELNNAVASGKSYNADLLKGISKRLGEKESQLSAVATELERSGLRFELHPNGTSSLRFIGEWRTLVENLLRPSEGQTVVPIPPEQYPLDPPSLLHFLQHTHKAYLTTVQRLQERCSTAERERDELRAMLASSSSGPLDINMKNPTATNTMDVSGGGEHTTQSIHAIPPPASSERANIPAPHPLQPFQFQSQSQSQPQPQTHPYPHREPVPAPAPEQAVEVVIKPDPDPNETFSF